MAFWAVFHRGVIARWQRQQALHLVLKVHGARAEVHSTPSGREGPTPGRAFQGGVELMRDQQWDPATPGTPLSLDGFCERENPIVR